MGRKYSLSVVVFALLYLLLIDLWSAWILQWVRDCPFSSCRYTSDHKCKRMNEHLMTSISFVMRVYVQLEILPINSLFMRGSFSTHSHLTCEERTFRNPRQWGHCDTGRPFLFMCWRGRSGWRREKSKRGILSVFVACSLKLTWVCTATDSMTTDASFASVFFALD